MSEKIVGYILLGVGLIMVFGALFSAYQVFTKRAKPIQLFNTPPIAIDASSLFGNSLSESGINIANENAKMELISADLINDSANLFAHLFFMGFIVTVGAKIANVGSTLLRPIVIKLSNEQSQKVLDSRIKKE